jgi:predicted NBD/HSP70 family sugar kinase
LKPFSLKVRLIEVTALHPSYLRQFHASQIFHALRAQPGISQKEVCDITGCDKSTVSIIIKRFEEIGLVERVTGTPDGRRGRPSEMIRISELSGLLMGVHLEFESLRLVAANVDGRPFASKGAPLPTNPNDLADQVRDGIIDLCAEIGRDISEIRAVGLTLPGLVGSSGGLAESSNLRWSKVAVPDLLKTKIGAPVYVDNDTNAATLAEYLFGECAHLSDFIMLDGGRGVGGGVFIDGRLYRGKNGFGGELGHIKVVKDGRICGCGAPGCLSAYLSAPALVERARRIATVSSLNDVLIAAETGNEDVRYILEEAGQFLGIAISTLINIFNPPAIALGGIIARMWPYMEASTQRSIAQNAMRAPLEQVEIIVSKISNSEVPWGGVALALEGFSSLNPAEPMPW